MKSKRLEEMTRRAFLVSGTALVGGSVLTLAGCNTPAHAENQAHASTASESQSSSVDASSSASSVSAPASKTLAGVSAYTSTNYNPIGLNGGATLTMSATRHVFEGLYDLDLHTYETYPALAEGGPVRLSRVEYLVTLRENALFSDGSRVTAADVVNAFEKNKASITIGPLLDFIDALVAQDDRTLSIILQYPCDGMLESRLSLVKVFPAAKEAELDTLPIGSGPWAYIPGKLNGNNSGIISFEPNQHYNGPVPAKADGMEWSVMQASEGMRVTALREGAVQVAEDISDGSADQLERHGATVEYVPGFCQAFLMFNTLKRPFTDKRVRQAIMYAINTNRLIDEALGGHALPLTSFLPEGHPNYHRASTVYWHDPERARFLLSAANHAQFEMTLLANNNWVSDLSWRIAEDLNAVGISCTVEQTPIPWNEFDDTGKVLPYDVVLAAGDPSCFGNDPDLLLSWWYSDGPWTRGRSCWAYDPNGSFDEMQKLLMAARQSAEDERQELWNRCFDIVSDEIPLYGLFHRAIATGWREDAISGFEPICTSGLDFLGCSVK